MNYDKNLHKLLDLLFSHGSYPDDEDQAMLRSFSLDEIKDKLKLSKLNTTLLLRSLINTEEIRKPKENTFVITPLGITAYTTRKYLKAYWKSIIDKIKDIASIVIPVLSLVVAILAISLKLNTPSKEDFKTLQKKVEQLEKKRISK